MLRHTAIGIAANAVIAAFDRLFGAQVLVHPRIAIVERQILVASIPYAAPTAASCARAFFLRAVLEARSSLVPSALTSIITGCPTESRGCLDQKGAAHHHHHRRLHFWQSGRMEVRLVTNYFNKTARPSLKVSLCFVSFGCKAKISSVGYQIRTILYRRKRSSHSYLLLMLV